MLNDFSINLAQALIDLSIDVNDFCIDAEKVFYLCDSSFCGVFPDLSTFDLTLNTDFVFTAYVSPVVEMMSIGTPVEFRNLMAFSMQDSYKSRNNDVNKIKEKQYSIAFANKFNGRTEVRCKAGSVDIVTDDEVIEVKKINGWKSAIGQIQAYSDSFPGKRKAVLLIDDLPFNNFELLYKIARKLNIKIYIASELDLDVSLNTQVEDRPRFVAIKTMLTIEAAIKVCSYFQFSDKSLLANELIKSISVFSESASRAIALKI